MFYTGRLRPEPPLPFLHTIFYRKGIPFVYLLLTNCTPFTQLVQNFASLLTAVNALSLKQESITKPERFLYFYSHKMHRLALLGLFTDRNDRFPLAFSGYFHYSDIPTLLYTSSLKRYPFRAEPPRIEYLPGFRELKPARSPTPFLTSLRCNC